MLFGDKKRQYQREWTKSRRDQWILSNGPCKKCGSSENLEVDHIDPKTKLYHPRELWNRKESTRLEELAKCQVLCEKCHLEKSRKDLSDMNTGKIYENRRTFKKEELFEILTEYFINKTSRRKTGKKFNIKDGTLSSIIYGKSYIELVKEFKLMNNIK